MQLRDIETLVSERLPADRLFRLGRVVDITPAWAEDDRLYRIDLTVEMDRWTTYRALQRLADALSDSIRVGDGMVHVTAWRSKLLERAAERSSL